MKARPQCLRQRSLCLRKSREWDQPLLSASLDVDKAFDQVEPRAMEDVTVYQKAPAWAIAAILRELAMQEARPAVGEVGPRIRWGWEILPGKARLAPPHSWEPTVSIFSASLGETWESEPPMTWCDAVAALPIIWFVDNAYVIADAPDKLQTKCRAQVEVAAAYGEPFSNDSLVTLQDGGEMSHISLADDRAFAKRAQIKVLGVTVDATGSTLTARLAREKEAMGVRFKHRGQLRCKRNRWRTESNGFTQRLGRHSCSAPGTLSSESWRRWVRGLGSGP